MGDSRAATTIILHRLKDHDEDEVEELTPHTADFDPLLYSPGSHNSSQWLPAHLGGQLSAEPSGSVSFARTAWKRATSRLAWITGLIVSILFVIAISLPRSTAGHAYAPTPINPEYWKGFDKIENYFAFGDSWTSTHYSISGEQPNEQNPFGNPKWPGIPSSMGPNYVAYLTGLYNQSFIKTWDFAFPGSVVDTHNDALFLDWLDFAHQLKDEFIAEHTVNNSGILAPKGWASNNTLFTIFFGINDVCLFDPDNPHLDKTYASYKSFTEQIYSAGGRNFVIMNVPPLQYAPNIQRAGDKKRLGADSDVNQFNDMLARLVKDLRSRHEDITVFEFDLHSLFGRMVQNPAAFPQTAIYKDVLHDCEQYSKHLDDMTQPSMAQVEACGGLEVPEYLWRDGLHVTYPVHKLMAAAMARLLASNGTVVM